MKAEALSLTNLPLSPRNSNRLSEQDIENLCCQKIPLLDYGCNATRYLKQTVYSSFYFLLEANVHSNSGPVNNRCYYLTVRYC
jgi:hypothetical protein